MSEKLRLNLKRWLPIALCILPGVAIAAAVSVGGGVLQSLAGFGAAAIPTIACIAGMIGVAALMRRE